MDIYEDRKRNENNTESVLDQIDFEIELTVRDIINFDYIILLIAGLKDIDSDDLKKKKTDEILKIFDRDIQLRKKKDLIKQFIEENLPKINGKHEVETKFNQFWNEEKNKKLQNLANRENIPIEKLEELVNQYLFNQRLPRSQEIVDSMTLAPKYLERKTIIERIKSAIQSIVDVFEW
ncbi:Type-1 restriction enzyme R protein [bioreactor metagenome]|uniref:Type-1 restriction enzyme R protein n=1 Tax=bioreactor metagenome TaxID=1076179 RepID=A0A645GM35_9ZZZZ